MTETPAAADAPTTGTDTNAPAAEKTTPADIETLVAEKLAAARGEWETAATEAQSKLEARAAAAEKRAQKATQQYEAMARRDAIIQAAAAAGCIDLDTLAVLAADKVTIAADGTATGATEAVSAIKAAKPHLFRPAGAGSRDAGSHTPSYALNDHDALEASLRQAVGL